MNASSSRLKFRKTVVPGVGSAVIPENIHLQYPEQIVVSKKDLHFLAYIPWNDSYLSRIPERYKTFFQFVLPHMKVRTTDVHTACSLAFLDDLLAECRAVINERIVAFALILHDVGWSKLSQEEIAASLGITGLSLSNAAIDPKEKHALEGVQIAKALLSEFRFADPLSDYEQHLILDAIRCHDRPEEVARDGEMPLEVQVVVDLDHIWSFTFENFWQDTVRKGVNPKEYAENLKLDLDSYFVTPIGKRLARELLAKRRHEVMQWIQYNLNNF